MSLIEDRSGEGLRPERPSVGDVCLGCMHYPDPTAAHYYFILGGIDFRRPDGTEDHAIWLLLCTACHVANVDQPVNAKIACDSVLTEEMELAVSFKNARQRN